MTNNLETAEILLFTDGACSGNPGPGGWAAILRHVESDTEKKLSGSQANTTNNRMEMMAVIEGLRAIKLDRPRRVCLVSDSQYVIHGLTQWVKGWIANDWRRGKKPNGPPVLNVDLWKTLYELSLQHEMSYEHVRGHTGHLENEECDRMAVQAIKDLKRGDG